MARKVSGKAHGQSIRFEPTAFDNRDAPTSERVVVYYTVPTEGDRREMNMFGDKQLIAKRGDDFDVTLDRAMALTKCQHACSLFVTRVDNYVDCNDEPIEDGNGLANHGETPFIVEIGGVILGHLDIDDIEKKHAELPALELDKTKVCDGTAENATSLDLTPQETATEKPQASGMSQKEVCSSASAPSAG